MKGAGCHKDFDPHPLQFFPLLPNKKEWQDKMAARAAAAGNAALTALHRSARGCAELQPGGQRGRNTERAPGATSAALLTPPDSAKVADNVNNSSGTDNLGRINTPRCIIL